MTYTDYFKEPTQDSSLEDKIAIIKENNIKSEQLQSELKRFKQTSTSTPQDIENIESNKTNTILNITPTKNKTTEIDELFNTIYLLDITNLAEEDIINELNNILKEHKTSAITIAKIKLMLYREYLLFSNMLFETTSKEEFKDLENILKDIKLKIDLLDDLEEEEEITFDELELGTKENNLFFLTNDNGKIIALESIKKSVPKEYYLAFKNLLLSLKLGTLKGVKKLKEQPFYELKDFKIRITFDKLSEGNYIIIDAFMKKYTMSAYYRKKLELRKTQLLLSKDYYLSKLNDKDFIEEHNKHLTDLLNLLDGITEEEDFPYERRLN